MSRNPYENESDLTSFATQFASVVAEHPEEFRVTSEEVTKLQAQVADWDQALAANVAAKDVAKSTTQAKQLTRSELTDLLRDLGRRIQADSNVSDAARAQAGLPIHKSTRTPVAVPKTAPVGRVNIVGPLQHSLVLYRGYAPRPTGRCDRLSHSCGVRRKGTWQPLRLSHGRTNRPITIRDDLRRRRQRQAGSLRSAVGQQPRRTGTDEFPDFGDCPGAVMGRDVLLQRNGRA